MKDIKIALEIMASGMAGIFLAIILIMIVIWLIQKVFKN